VQTAISVAGVAAKVAAAAAISGMTVRRNFRGRRTHLRVKNDKTMNSFFHEISAAEPLSWES
jgi:hypothetical protein